MKNKKKSSPCSTVKGAYTDNGHTVENDRLRNLSDKERGFALSQLQFVKLPMNTVIHEMGEAIRFGYFVNSGLASVVNVMKDGRTAEIGMIGKEGFAGLPLVVGRTISPHRIVVQAPLTAYRIAANRLEGLVQQCPKLGAQLNEFAQELGMQVGYIAACNRLHQVDERLARWLLMSQDRIGENCLPFTHDLLAQMLGTRRASVTLAAGILQKAELIRGLRGEVEILDRGGLEAVACECYSLVQQQRKMWRSEAR
jgi:CRP-like cAMP-binding protein